MDEKQKKKYILQIIRLSSLIFLFCISIIFTSSFSANIKKVLYKMDIKASTDDLVVHYINVGQGDAIALKFANDKIMLIDSGPKSAQNDLIKYIKDNVLKGNNDLVIDYVILTHSDIDHSGGMSGVFVEFDVKTFFRPNIASESENVEDFAKRSTLDEYEEVIKNSKEEKGLITNIINQEFEFNIDKAVVQIFPPFQVYSTTNSMSPIVKVSYLDKSFLFTGDIQEDAEKDMLNYYGKKLNADVLKVAHHGSKTSTSNDFVEAVNPQYAIISVGENTYGHPHFETVSMLQDFNAKVLLTSEGSIVFVCGSEMFGVLDSSKIHSSEFLNWWIIALTINIGLIYYLMKSIIKFITCSKKSLNK